MDAQKERRERYAMARVHNGVCKTMEAKGRLIFIGRCFNDEREPNYRVYECNACHRRYREDEIEEDQYCPNCNHEGYINFLEEEAENGTI
jgi:PHP family Zn ribbon phosphoesterase